MKQDERVPFVDALHRRTRGGVPAGRVRRAGELHARQRDSGTGRSGRHRRRGVGAGPVLRNRRAGAVHHPRASVAHIWGVDYSRSAIELARQRAGQLPCRFEVSRIPPIPSGPFDVVLLLETMLAFPEKAPLVQEISGALSCGGRFAFTLEAGLPLTESERAAMPDADTVWPIPLTEMLSCLERAGLVVRWQEDWSRSHARHGGFVARRVRR